MQVLTAEALADGGTSQRSLSRCNAVRLASDEAMLARVMLRSTENNGFNEQDFERRRNVDQFEENRSFENV